VTDNAEGANQAFDSSGAVIPKTIYANSGEELILVRKNALQLLLQEKVERIGKRDRWLVPLGILVPLVLALATTNFAQRFGIGGDEWETIFIVLFLLDLLWLAYEVRQRGRPVTANSIVEELEKGCVEIETLPISRKHILSGESDTLQTHTHPQLVRNRWLTLVQTCRILIRRHLGYLPTGMTPV
jgi:hypothetical protein